MLAQRYSPTATNQEVMREDMLQSHIDSPPTTSWRPTSLANTTMSHSQKALQHLSDIARRNITSPPQRFRAVTSSQIYSVVLTDRPRRHAPGYCDSSTYKSGLLFQCQTCHPAPYIVDSVKTARAGNLQALTRKYVFCQLPRHILSSHDLLCFLSLNRDKLLEPSNLV
ncbi:Uncharacterized protein LW93_5995 [Fusarium fujikuroi]|nr:Uncharacterized protein LW93_5995 [Fusarium fujikuroi]